ncbi:MAG: sigma-70 family RNA polymerase sigma factor [Gammaproteobacteria bacterium]|nr:sigma-70 family RNA polymerase sigma factor [Gammaproteobacteria bacterium]MBU1723587.1 sigma-70 family RNA polymerase sigma factor [Gammaproteobacteria bacterium]MBU2004242.1 sigma-70 family RNA polymerase sigma factor [Gammaproteobacteria bacterium]
MDELSEWLVRSGRGDANAFQHVYGAASPRLYALCLRMMRDEGRAEDVLQEGFIKIWNHAASFAPGKAAAMTWMTTIIRNHALDKLRALNHQPEIANDMEYESLEFASLDMSPDALADLHEDTQRLVECLHGLKEEQRECVMQAYYYGYTHDELADRLMKPLGTIKAWIRRGLEQLRLCLS